MTSNALHNTASSLACVEILTPKRASKLTGLSPPTLQRMRSHGTGPAFISCW